MFVADRLFCLPAITKARYAVPMQRLQAGHVVYEDLFDADGKFPPSFVHVPDLSREAQQHPSFHGADSMETTMKW